MVIRYHNHGLSPAFVQQQLKRHDLLLSRQREALSQGSGNLSLYQRTAIDYAGYLMLDQSNGAKCRLWRALAWAAAATEALGPLAFTAIALRRSWEITVVSDYLPVVLIDRRPAPIRVNAPSDDG